MTDPHPWTDADVDRALTRFFAAEQPSEMPGLPPRLAVRQSPALTRRQRRQATRGTVATIVSAIVVAGLLIVIAPPDRQPPAIVQTTEKPPQEVIVAVTEPGPREVFATPAGLMRQQTDLKVTTVSWVAPDSGDAIEWQVPELAIDIVPVASNDAGDH